MKCLVLGRMHGECGCCKPRAPRVHQIFVADGVHRKWLELDGDKVVGLVLDLFGEEVTCDATTTGGLEEWPYSEEEVMGWVRHALAGTKNSSAAGPDEVGYKLIKTVRDTRLGDEVLREIVAALTGGYIPNR